jgi:large subunit ribosomal protein L3
MVGILGKKLGMTQIFDAKGERQSVTLVEVGPCAVLKTYQKGDLAKVQLGFGDFQKESAQKHINKAQLGMFKKINVKPKKFVREVMFGKDNIPAVGSTITADIFKEGDYADVTGVSIGKGFQGGMKRWNWRGGPMSHGSTSHRRVGSIGSNTFPGRVFRGHHMPGHMGNKRITVQNLKILRADAQNNLLVIQGAVVGHKNNYLIIQKARKKKASVSQVKS